MKNTIASGKLKTSKIAIASALSLVFLNGCATTQTDSVASTNNTTTASQQKQIETILEQQQQILATLQAQPGQFDEQDKVIAKLSEQLDQLNTSANSKGVAVVPKKSKSTDDYSDKLILGQEEWVWFDELKTNYKARIDTGATTSSLNAIDIVKFERDGKNWVKFNLAHQDKTENVLVEARVLRTIDVRQADSEKATERYVVSLPIQLGSIKTKAEFSLADRSDMNFPVLLGRSFLQDIAVVDVAQKYLQPKTTIKATKKGTN